MNDYKVSMFTTYTVNKRDEIILYNSLYGLESIRCIISNIDVLHWLNKKITYKETNDKTFKWLIDNNYLVKLDVDEKARRNVKIANLLEDGTLHMTIHLTENCNFRCEYCAINENYRDISAETENGIIDFIRKNIFKYKAIQIDWFGGEPLLKIETIIRMSKSIKTICNIAKKPYCASITTNGYLLSPDIVKKLIECKVKDYCVTIDGNKDVHDNMRKLISGKGTYEQIINNLMNIKNEINNGWVNFTIRVNLTKDSVVLFDDFYEELNRIFGDDNRFSIFLKKVNDWGAKGINKIKDQLIDSKEIFDVLETIKDTKKDLSIIENFNELEFGGRCCTASRSNSYTIYADGMVGKCENPNSGLIIGHINDPDLSLKDSMDYPRWCSRAYDMPQECDDCFMSPLCFSQECPKLLIAKAGDSCFLTEHYIKKMLEFYVEFRKGKVIYVDKK